MVAELHRYRPIRSRPSSNWPGSSIRKASVDLHLTEQESAIGSWRWSIASELNFTTSNEVRDGRRP